MADGNRIDADGLIVGTSDATSATHAFLYDGSTMLDHNHLLTGCRRV